MQIVSRSTKTLTFDIPRLSMQKTVQIDTVTLDNGAQYQIEGDEHNPFAIQTLHDDIYNPIEVAPYEICPLYFPDNVIDSPLFKIKVKNMSPDEALTLLLPMKGRYRVDVNQGWTLDETLYFLDQLNLDHVDCIEEPCKDYDALCSLAKRYPIALDESLVNGVDITPFDTLVVKPSRLSNFMEYLTSGKRLILSSNFDSKVGLNQIIRLAQRYGVTEPLGIDTMKYCRKIDAP